MVSDSPDGWLRERAATSPDHPFLRAPKRDLSFADIDDRVTSAAGSLLAHGAEPGRPLAIVTTSAETLLVAVLAGFRGGIPVFPLNPRLHDEGLAARLALADTRLVLSDRPLAFARNIPLAALDAPAPPVSPTPLGAGDVHVIIATSGSTGTPKGVMLTGSNLAAAIRASRARLPLEPGDCWLGCLPFAAIGGLSIPLRCLEAGASFRPFDSFDATAVAHSLSAGEATHVSLAPAMLAPLLDTGIRPAPALRFALVGGAALSPSLAARALASDWPLIPTYGMSEAGSQVATFTSDIREWRPGMAGPPLPGLEIGIGGNGRIRLKGPSVMAGYVNPALNPGDGLDREGWFETSDLGRIDASGRLVVLGRADDVLVSGGHNIHPLEVEQLAGHCPGVRTVAVTGLPDPVWGERLVAVIVGETTEGNFLSWCRENLPSHLRPRLAIKADALPRLASDKLDRAALRALAKHRFENGTFS